MRTLSVIIGCAAVLALSGAAAASTIEFHFARLNTSQTEFSHDQQVCSRSALSRYMPAHSAGNGGSALRYRVYETEPAHYVRPSLFLNCMIDKGYQPNPTGFSTGRLWQPA
jgi:hypothetical protein